jgi:hypothetical protein
MRWPILLLVIALPSVVMPPAPATARQASVTTRELHGLGRIEVEPALRLKTTTPIVMASGTVLRRRVTLMNRTTRAVAMGDAGAYLDSVITDLSRGVVGGTVVAGSIDIGRFHPAIRAKGSARYFASIAALRSPMNGERAPLAPGSYLLWVELPRISETALRVAGPVRLVVT